jgi:hypothetical protein
VQQQAVIRAEAALQVVLRVHPVSRMLSSRWLTTSSTTVNIFVCRRVG